MISLSSALRRDGPLPTDLPPYFSGTTSCPLGAAYVRTLPPERLESFLSYARAMDRSVFCEFMHREIMRTFPWLGYSVRAFPVVHDNQRIGSAGIATGLERLGLLPCCRYYQVSYRRAVHKSLWTVITKLHDRNFQAPAIADLLWAWGL